MTEGPEPAFVLSLLLSDASEPTTIVLAVRRPAPNMPRHPGVLSTPTQRLPRALFEACRPGWPVPGASARFLDVASRPTSPIGCGLTSDRPLSYAVESLLARKLGLAGPLADGSIPGMALPLGVAAAVVDDPGGTGLAEPTVMLTARVVVSHLTPVLPASTDHYGPIVRAEMSTFVAAVQANDALIISEALDPFEVCIGGLCVTSAASIVETSLRAASR